MDLSISNIAWDVSDDGLIAKLLKKQGLNYIDIAPGKYFRDPKLATEHDIKKVRSYWDSNGIQIYGMQALLFGTEGLNLFGDNDVRKRMLTHLEAICRIASILGVRCLVFGSPGNRDRNTLDDNSVLEIGISFFQELGEISKLYGVNICIEPNPAIYNANFLTSTEETAFFVRNVNHSNIKLQLDTGAICINDEDLENVLLRFSDLIGHVHLSEPQLVPYGQSIEVMASHGNLIRKYLPNHVLSIEMLKVDDDLSYNEVFSAIQTARVYFSSI
jgi:D-psicose/D-tagatose/L-ribulose 3-epimerase